MLTGEHQVDLSVTTGRSIDNNADCVSPMTNNRESGPFQFTSSQSCRCEPGENTTKVLHL